MTFDLVEIAEGEPGRFWHVNDDCDVRVDTFFCFSNVTQRSARKGRGAECGRGLVLQRVWTAPPRGIRQICAVDLSNRACHAITLAGSRCI